MNKDLVFTGTQFKILGFEKFYIYLRNERNIVYAKIM